METNALDDRLKRARATLVSLLGAADSTRRFLGAVVEEYGVTLQQYNVLRILKGAAPNPLPTMTIGQRMLEKTPGITRLVDGLESRGLLRRERCDEDRRRVHAWITQAGLELLADMDETVDQADLRLIEGQSGAAVDRLVRTLDAIAANVGSRPPAATSGRR